MTVLAREYTDLDHALDEVRVVLEERAAEQEEEVPALNDETVRYAQLVLHEWIANLLQHANFRGRSPTLQIHLLTEGRRIACTVVDNSEGFDLAEHIPVEKEPPDELPERGMGLRIIDACTDRLSYISTESGRYRLEFSIPADHDPWLSTIF